MSDIAIHNPLRPDARAKRAHLRIDAADAGDQPVGMRQVKAGVVTQRHDRRSGPRCPNACDDAEHSIVIHQRIVIRGRQREAPREMLALNPVLKLAGRVAGIVTNLKHGNDHHFDRNASRSLRNGGHAGKQQNSSKEEAHEPCYRLALPAHKRR